MSADNRTVATDALATLGTIIDSSQKRDAIHLAVIPAIAGHMLDPGDDVFIRDGDGVAWFSQGAAKGIGIVDPFLTVPVREGEWFWLVIYPRQINSLRHVWTHPALPDEPSPAVASAPTANRSTSEEWLRAFCERADIPYERLMEMLSGNDVDLPDSEHDRVSAYVSEFGISISGSSSWQGTEVPPEFWEHAEAVLGRPFSERPTGPGSTYFSCSC